MLCAFFFKNIFLTRSKHQCFKDCYQARIVHDSIQPAQRAEVCNRNQNRPLGHSGEQHILSECVCVVLSTSGTWPALTNACCGISLGFVNMLIAIGLRKVVFEPNSLDYSIAMEGYYNRKSSSWTQSKYEGLNSAGFCCVELFHGYFLQIV